MDETDGMKTVDRREPTDDQTGCGCGRCAPGDGRASGMTGSRARQHSAGRDSQTAERPGAIHAADGGVGDGPLKRDRPRRTRRRDHNALSASADGAQRPPGGVRRPWEGARGGRAGPRRDAAARRRAEGPTLAPAGPRRREGRRRNRSRGASRERRPEPAAAAARGGRRARCTAPGVPWGARDRVDGRCGPSRRRRGPPSRAPRASRRNWPGPASRPRARRRAPPAGRSPGGATATERGRQGRTWWPVRGKPPRGSLVARRGRGPRFRHRRMFPTDSTKE